MRQLFQTFDGQTFGSAAEATAHEAGIIGGMFDRPTMPFSGTRLLSLLKSDSVHCELDLALRHLFAETARVPVPAVNPDMKYTLDAVRDTIIKLTKAFGPKLAVNVVTFVSGKAKASELQPSQYESLIAAMAALIELQKQGLIGLTQKGVATAHNWQQPATITPPAIPPATPKKEVAEVYNTVREVIVAFKEKARYPSSKQVAKALGRPFALLLKEENAERKKVMAELGIELREGNPDFENVRSKSPITAKQGESTQSSNSEPPKMTRKEWRKNVSYLTKREREIAILVVQNTPCDSICRMLDIAASTYRGTLARAMVKMRVENLQEMAFYVSKYGI